MQYVDQGAKWTSLARSQFYIGDQGSRIIPYAWIKALKLPDGRGFLDDGLARYGYLQNSYVETPGLPVGFHTADLNGVKTLGATCAACHVRQIEVDGVSWRIDGAPALADLQRLFADIDAAMSAATANDAAFTDFAGRVLGPSASEAGRMNLRREVDAWFLPYHSIMSKALPSPGWGPGRADAVSMIFNRVAGLDVGPPPTYLIEENIAPADAPIRYPFIWNAPFQDRTQWPGFAKNGDDIAGLARNLGEVLGVFGVYHPKKLPVLGFVDYLDGSSANFPSLITLEALVKQMDPPKWPWKIDAALATKGKEIFDRDPKEGGCGPGCHEIKPGQQRPLNNATWSTPLFDVGTDSKQYTVLGREGLTGALEGVFNPLVAPAPLKHKDKIFYMLGVSVLGSIAQNPIHWLTQVAIDPERAPRFKLPPFDSAKLGSPIEVLNEEVQDMYDREVAEAAPPAPPSFKYETRVLQGIWAAAPYLHNGSVPTLAELLKPPAERVQSFKIGPAYDTENVGLAKEQPQSDYEYGTTGCDQRGSGTSRCGHDFGTRLSPDEKKALLEYLKEL